MRSTSRPRAGPNIKPPAVDAARTKLAVANEPAAARANSTNAIGVIVLATPRAENEVASLGTPGERRSLL
ncbi:MAG: hypothetical protein ACLP50_26115 [Solirubrobacteraceae bacterium]